MDNPDVRRPWRCPAIMMLLGTALAYVNAFLLGAGANVWGTGTFVSGWVSAAIVVPVYAFRHYLIDGGKFPVDMWKDLLLPGQKALGPKRAGVLPYVALAGGLASMFAGYFIFW